MPTYPLQRLGCASFAALLAAYILAGCNRPSGDNLATDPAYADTLATLRAACERWAASMPDFGLMPEPAYVASIWPEGVQPLTAAPAATNNAGRIHLASATDGASIGYQIEVDGAEPAAAWQIYTAPVPLSPGTHLVAQAHRIGYRPSASVVVEAER